MNKGIKIILLVCLLLVGLIGGIVVGLNHNRFDKSNPIIFKSSQANNDYRSIIYEDKEYVPYSAISPVDRKQYLGYVDDDKTIEIYTYKNYSKDEWIIEYSKSVMSDCMLYREKNVTNIPNGLSSEYEWNIENKQKSAKDFEIIFKNREPINSYNKVYAILDKSETDKYDYSVYAYDGSVSIKIDDKEYSLRDALIENKITMEEIISKADKDISDPLVYEDGGSKEYHYENYTIIKFNNLDENRDVYIGIKDMTINDIQ